MRSEAENAFQTGWTRLGAVQRLDAALAANPDCSTVPMIAQRVFATHRGPTGGPELLALVHVRDLARGCVYGHVRRSHSSGFAAMLLRSDRFITADTPLLLFRRFDYWISARMDFHPLSQERDGDTFSPCPDAASALGELVRMIMGFSIATRWPEDEETYVGLGTDLRILDLFGFTAKVEAQADPGRPPAALRSVPGGAAPPP